jgi:hypothetical protein
MIMHAFKVAVTGTEGGLPFVAGLDPDEIVSTAKVEFFKNLGLAKAIKSFRNKGQGFRPTILKGP